MGSEAVRSSGDRSGSARVPVRVAVLCGLMVLCVIAYASGWYPPAWAATSTAILEVRITNVRDSAFTVSWITDGPATGQVNYGTSAGELNQTGQDVRGAGTVDDTHYVTISGLTPEATYYFEVVSDGVTQGGYEVTTGPTLGLREPDLIYGQVFKADGSTPAEGTIVYLTLSDGDGLGSPGESAPMSGLVEPSGWWSFNLENARVSTLDAYFNYSASGDDLELIAQGAGDGTDDQTIDTGNTKPAPAMTLEVAVQPATSVSIAPQTETVTAGQSVVYTLTAEDDLGNTWDVTDEGSFAIDSEAGGGFVDNVYTSEAAGQWTVTGTYEGLEDTAQLTVEPGEAAEVEVSPSSVTLAPAGTQQFEATCYDAFDNEAACAPSWSVANPDAGTIDAAGLFTAGSAPGTYPAAVVASVDGVTGTADVTISEGELDRIQVTPSSVTLAPAGTQQFEATCYDEFDNEVTCTPSWSVTDADAGTIDAAGLFTAGSTPGTYPDAVVASVDGVMGTADVTVQSGVVPRLYLPVVIANR